MTDRYTDELFTPALPLGGTLFLNRTSRLAMDPGRFSEDLDEAARKLLPGDAFSTTSKGMGPVYTRTCCGKLLRREGFFRGRPAGDHAPLLLPLRRSDGGAGIALAFALWALPHKRRPLLSFEALALRRTGPSPPRNMVRFRGIPYRRKPASGPRENLRPLGAKRRSKRALLEKLRPFAFLPPKPRRPLRYDRDQSRNLHGRGGGSQVGALCGYRQRREAASRLCREECCRTRGYGSEHRAPPGASGALAFEKQVRATCAAGFGFAPARSILWARRLSSPRRSIFSPRAPLPP